MLLSGGSSLSIGKLSNVCFKDEYVVLDGYFWVRKYNFICFIVGLMEMFLGFGLLKYKCLGYDYDYYYW